MDQKTEITKLVLNSLGLEATEKRVKQTLPVWWQNPRKKSSGGLRLTQQGFECLQKADIKAHRVRFEKTHYFNNKLIIQLDNFIDCPWYVNNKEIYVFGEKMAIQLVLFSGDIEKFSSAKAKSILTKH